MPVRVPPAAEVERAVAIPDFGAAAGQHIGDVALAWVFLWHWCLIATSVPVAFEIKLLPKQADEDCWRG